MKLRHGREKSGEGFALTCFKLPDEMIYGLLDEQLRGIVALGVALLIRRVAPAPKRRITLVRRGVAAVRCAIAGGVDPTVSADGVGHVLFL